MMLTLSKENHKKLQNLTRKYAISKNFLLVRSLIMNVILDELTIDDIEFKFLNFSKGGKKCEDVLEDVSRDFDVADIRFINSVFEEVNNA